MYVGLPPWNGQLHAICQMECTEQPHSFHGGHANDAMLLKGNNMTLTSQEPQNLRVPG